ncbi:hypothetical protein SASPL_152052 [Salvia splendens]|uniref:TNFR-Cys domain-containing protein n=1 Tax=Salvia splendens TaxID=180675 RepID=A0A8X8W2J2_SALSN|nr:hypothetical protein SASPL_152052 [Salvia splendens]
MRGGPFIVCLVMLILLLVAPPCTGCSPSGNGGCRNCIVRQLKSGCPRCVPIMQCMGRCLWGGASRSNCVKKCDCGSGYPRLADCKKCLSQCKCSCSVSA